MKEDRGGEEGSIVREVLEVRNTLSATRDACGGQHQKCLSVRPSTSLFVCLSVCLLVYVPRSFYHATYASTQALIRRQSYNGTAIILTQSDAFVLHAIHISGWRAAVYRTDGTLDLGVHLNSWGDADKISILKVTHSMI